MRKVKSLSVVLLVLVLLAALAPRNALSDAAPVPMLGSVSESTYWNDQLSIGYELPDSDWFFYTEDEILEINQLTGEMLGDDFQKALDSLDSYTDMFAGDSVTGENVNITVEKLSGLNALIVSEKSYIQLGAKGLEEALKQMGVEDFTTSSEDFTIDGETHPGCRVSYTLQGVPIYQTLVVVKSEGKMLTITVTAFQADACDSILEGFFRSK